MKGRTAANSGVSMIAADGSLNSAPYRFFNAVAEAPPMLARSSAGGRAPRRGSSRWL